MDGEIGRLALQIVGVIVMTIAIGILVPLAESRDDRSADDDRPDRVF